MAKWNSHNRSADKPEELSTTATLTVLVRTHDGRRYTGRVSDIEWKEVVKWKPS